MFFLALNKFYRYFQSYQLLLQRCGFISFVILDGIEIRFQNIHIQECAALHWLGIQRRWNHAEKVQNIVGYFLYSLRCFTPPIYSLKENFELLNVEDPLLSWPVI